MSQETRSPIDVAGEYWATYNPQYVKTYVDGAKDDLRLKIEDTIKPGNIDWSTAPYERWEAELSDLYPAEPAVSDPWVNGRYALAALAWGLVALVVLGVGAGP